MGHAADQGGSGVLLAEEARRGAVGRGGRREDCGVGWRGDPITVRLEVCDRGWSEIVRGGSPAHAR